MYKIEYFIVLLISIISFNTFIYCQNQNILNLYKYDEIDSRLIEKIKWENSFNSKIWIKYVSLRNGISFYYPPDFNIETKYFKTFCDSIILVGSYKDSILYDYVRISFIKDGYGSAVNYTEFNESKLPWLFVEDSLGNILDSGQTFRILYGHQGAILPANIIEGDGWKGLEGTTCQGVYSDNGYLGLTSKKIIFLFFERKNNCNIVVEYTDRPFFYDDEKDKIQPKKFLYEDIFYSIISSISDNK